MKRDMSDQKSVSRRDFIKTTATGAGAAAIAGLGVEAVKPKGALPIGTRKRMSSSSAPAPRDCPQRFKLPKAARR